MKSNHLYFFLIGICAALFYYINVLIPVISDDILYSCIFPAETSLDTPWGVNINNPIQDVHDVFVSQYNHYFYHGGRIPVHILVQLFAGLWGKVPFSVVTVFFFIAFIWILGLNSFDQNTEKIVFFIPFFLFFVFIVQPKCFYSTIATSINYLWASVICLTYYYIYEKKIVNNPIKIVCYWLLAFFAGWSHEGIVIPLGVAIGLQFLTNYKQIPLYNKLSVLFFFMGAILLVLAPGNFARGGGSSVSLYSFITCLFHLRLFWMFIFSLFCILFFRGWNYVKGIIVDNSYLICGIICGIILFLYSGLLELRLGYGIDLLSIVLLSRIIAKSVSCQVLKSIGLIISFTTVIVLGVVSFYQGKANSQFTMVINAIESTNKTKILVNIPQNLIAPNYLEGYIRDVAHDSAKGWILSVWEAKYDKIDIVINEGN